MKTELKWTKEPPTEEGWYWVHNKFASWFGEVRIVFIEKGQMNNSMAVWEISENNWIGLKSYVETFDLQWLGPLSIPNVPEKNEKLNSNYEDEFEQY